ncbi:MAG: exonuclease SbcCD subunit D [Paracoccaceae bacterium]
MSLRVVHASDLHLGRAFAGLPEDVRGRLVEARHAALAALAAAARAHGAAHVLLAGDTFDSETPSEPVLRQALAAMAEARDLTWWLLPGNHDSLAAEALWDRLAGARPPNVAVLAEAAPVEIAPGLLCLPAPVTRRAPGRDLTEWMTRAESAPGTVRLGLAHGPVASFGRDGEGSDVIAPDRAASAGLDYLALGDWHGRRAVCARSGYCGTPARARFKHDGRGVCLVVALDGPGSVPVVEPVEIGTFDWVARDLLVTPRDDPETLVAEALPREHRRDTLLSLTLTGRTTLAGRLALGRAIAAAAPEFWYVETDDTGLASEPALGDLDAIAPSGALRLAADTLAAETAGADPRRAAVAGAALGRLYALLAEAGS